MRRRLGTLFAAVALAGGGPAVAAVTVDVPVSLGRISWLLAPMDATIDASGALAAYPGATVSAATFHWNVTSHHIWDQGTSYELTETVEPVEGGFLITQTDLTIYEIDYFAKNFSVWGPGLSFSGSLPYYDITEYEEEVVDGGSYEEDGITYFYKYIYATRTHTFGAWGTVTGVAVIAPVLDELNLHGHIDVLKDTNDYIDSVTGVLRLTLTGPGTAVPEPATWAVMVGGFGVVGAVLRRRRAMAA